MARPAGPSFHVERDVLVVELALDLDDRVPGPGIVLADVFLGIFDEQRIDVHDVAEDLLVVRADTQRAQRAGDDVDEPPGELTERRAVAFAGELAGEGGDSEIRPNRPTAL